MGLVRTLKRRRKEIEDSGEMYASYKNMILYGSFGKSALCGALSTKLKQPVLLLSPSGGSELITKEYPNVISYPVNSLKDINAVYDDLTKDFKTIKDLQDVIRKDDKERLEKAKEYYGDDWEDVYGMAKNNEFSISAIVLEEMSMVSNWIQEDLEDELEATYIGEDKNKLGADWAKFSREVLDFYSKLLRLPVTTILSTGMIQPKEKQKLQQIIPDICQGNASRKIIDLVGSVFYCYRTDDLKYKIRLTGNKDVYAKDKLLPIRTDKKLEEELDLTGNPEYFWEYVDSLADDRKIIKTKK